MEDPDYGVAWEPITPKGANPGKISHHKPAVFGQSVVVFGGIKDYENNEEAFEYDAVKNTWYELKQTGDVPAPRDDHSLNLIDDERFMIFGGFVAGSRVNEAYVCRKNGNTLEWTRIGENSQQRPSIRASHSAVIHNNKCYIFGGQDDDNNKLNDLWELDLATEAWTEVELAPGSYPPACRSGHSANLFRGKMYVFGGILELTKELNEMLCYDFEARSFSLIGNASNIDEAF